MQKGIPENERDFHWHKHHAKKLKRDKIHHRSGYVLQASKFGLKEADEYYQKAQARKRGFSIWYRLWLWFISTRLIVLIRKFLYWRSERQYRG